MINTVILSGGSGTRLWPLSRNYYPKQFQNLVDDKSLFQNTIIRLNGLDISKNIVVCNEKHRFIVASQLQKINKTADIILEPEPKNTAPAILLVALKADKDAMLLILPSDYSIKNVKTLHSAINKAYQYAKKDYFVTFGIKPTSAETGYGYIEAGNSLEKGVNKINQFIEKPDKKRAESYISKGNYTWNSGMFRASNYFKALSQFEPKMLKSVKKIFQ